MEDETLHNDNIKSESATTATSPVAKPASAPATHGVPSTSNAVDAPKAEYGGPKGLEPTRYGDWERNGRCCDF